MCRPFSAHDASARVLLIEKMPDPGGISICSGRRVAVSRRCCAAARAYLNSTNGGATPEPINTDFADAMMELDAYVNSLAQACGATTTRVERLGNYPFEGFDRLYFLEIDTIPGFDPKRDYPAVKALRGGPKMFRVLQTNVEMRAIDVRYQTRARNLIFGPRGEVRGIWIESDAGPRAVAAHKGVILACGGFENDPRCRNSSGRSVRSRRRPSGGTRVMACGWPRRRVPTSGICGIFTGLTGFVIPTPRFQWASG